MKQTARILIADHDETSMMALESTLIGAGYKVHPTRTGQDALKDAMTFKPHVCIIDPMLPDIDGFSLSMEIKGLGKPVRILVSTATPMDDHAKKEARSRFGVAYCLVKPYSNEKLLKVVKAVLTPKKKDQEAPKEKETHHLSRELDEMLEKTLSGINLGAAKKRKKKVSDSQKIFTGSRPPIEKSPISGDATMQIDPNDLKLEMEKIKLEMTNGGDAPIGGPEVRFRKSGSGKGENEGIFTSNDIFGALIQDIEEGKVKETEFTLPGSNEKKPVVTPPEPEPEIDLFPDKEEDSNATLESAPLAIPEPAPGNQYQFLEKIATGGMAEVWKGKLVGEKGFEKIVAIKKILTHLSANEEFITMFTDEAKVAAKLTHPNIAQIYELKTGDPAFIAMEYVSGHTLRQILLRCRKLNITLAPQIVAYVGMKLCNALYYAHNKKDFDGTDLHIVHRDVSPQNVIISQDGEIKLVDFGIAKASIKATETVAGSLKGKLLYMSPEQGDGKPLDHRSDIFSLANILYEAMTGQRLFEGNSELAILNNVRSATFRQARELNPSIPRRLEEILNLALTQDPNQRYDSAKSMENDLKDFLKEEKSHLNEGDIAAYLENLFDGDLHKLARFHESTLGTPLPVMGKPPGPRPATVPAPTPVAPTFETAPPPPKRVTRPAPPVAQPPEPPIITADDPPVPYLLEQMKQDKNSSGMRYVLGLVALAAVAVIVWFLYFRHPEQVPAPVNSVETEQNGPQSTTNLPPTLENGEPATDKVTSVDENSTVPDAVEENKPTDLNPGAAENPGNTIPSVGDQLDTGSLASGQSGSEQGTAQIIDPVTGQPFLNEKNPELERMEAEKARKFQELEALRQQEEAKKKQEEAKKKKKKDN